MLQRRLTVVKEKHSQADERDFRRRCLHGGAVVCHPNAKAVGETRAWSSWQRRWNDATTNEHVDRTTWQEASPLICARHGRSYGTSGTG